MSQSSGGVGSADESEGSAIFGICECGDCVFEGIEPISHSVVDVALDVGVSDKSVDDLSATHQIIISNTSCTQHQLICKHINHITPSCCLLRLSGITLPLLSC